MTKQEKIMEGMARKLAFYAREDDWENLNSFRRQVYLYQALVIMAYEASQGVVIKVGESHIINDLTCVFDISGTKYAKVEPLI